MKIAVVGAGLAGSECAWILAHIYKLDVTLFEMKSKNPTPAQDAPHLFAELVCSNSLKSTSRLNPAGLLKEELTKLGSLVVAAARRSAVPAGETLAVDREAFSGSITQALRSHPKIRVVETVVESLSQIFSTDSYAATVIATGPLTADALAEDLRKLTSSESLYFYDAIAPIVDGSTIDRSIAFVANRETRTHRFEKRQQREAGLEPLPEEEGHYLNLPLTKEQYFSFVEKVVAGAKVPFHNFEEPKFFNGCQPIEVLAESGPLTLAHGPMKARGLTDPRTGRWPFAAVQLRKEKLGDAAYNMVGFQTRLTWTAQKEILRTLPGLENAEFFRFGSMHRNTYLVSPRLLNADFSLKADSRVYLAGQVMGVEGYLESAAMGCFMAHVIGNKFARNRTLEAPPPHTSLGTLARHCLHTDPSHYSPMNIHWGLFDELVESDVTLYGKHLPPHDLNRKKLDKSVKRSILAERADKNFDIWLNNSGLASLMQESAPSFHEN